MRPVVVGLDLGTALCGIAAYDPEMKRGSRLRASKVLKPLGKQVERRWQVVSILEKIRQRAGIQALVMEDIGIFFYGGGAHARFTSIKGVIALAASIEDWCFQQRIPCYQVVPNHWRKVVLGNGRAKKKDSVAWVKKEFDKKVGDDEAEAIAMSCYLAKGGK